MYASTVAISTECIANVESTTNQIKAQLVHALSSFEKNVRAAVIELRELMSVYC